MTRPPPAEPPNGTMLIGFIDGNAAGAWHRADSDPVRDGRRWYSTYCGTPSRGFTWDEAQERGAHHAYDLHSSPTQDAYDAACAALRKHQARAEAAEAQLAGRAGITQTVAELRTVAADLDGHIERHAIELAAPIIEAAQKAADAAIHAAEADALRWKYLNAELGRQVKALESQIERARKAGTAAARQPSARPKMGEWVKADCGCIWRESRPDGMALDPSEPRVCSAHPADHPASVRPSPQGRAMVYVTYHDQRPDADPGSASVHR